MTKSTKEDWSTFLGGRAPLFEIGEEIIYVDFFEESQSLCTGFVTNIGFHKDGEIDVPVEDGNFQSALEEVYEQLLNKLL